MPGRHNQLEEQVPDAPGSEEPQKRKTAAGTALINKKYREIVKENTVNALETILDIMENGKPQERLKAAEIILERSQGKPTQPVDAEISGKVKVEILIPPGMEDLLG